MNVQYFNIIKSALSPLLSNTYIDTDDMNNVVRKVNNEEYKWGLKINFEKLLKLI